ncbi:MAG: DUF2922 domain-containing protein [Synergistota bacterium]|nr:DUF2922 domain-containing protein [Synergistota bacterium]
MKTVKMTFGRSDGTKKSISLKHAKETLTETEVRTAMQSVIDNGVVLPAVTTIVEAELIDRTVEEIITQ